MSTLAKAALVFYLALSCMALAQEHKGHHGIGHERWHGEFYSKLMRPDTGKKFDSCCNLKDCTPTVSRSSPYGYYEIMVEGRWVIVPQKKIVPVTAPDLGAHVCHQKIDPRYPDNINLYCVVLPPES